MGRLIVLDRTGHTTLEWAVGDRTQSEVDAIFAAMVKEGRLAYRVESPSKGAVIREFDPQAETIVMALPLAGG